MGRIDRRVAEICKLAFNMEILYFDQFNYPEYEKKYHSKKESLNEILKKSDFISINLPYQPNLYHLISKKQLNIIKKEAFLINTAQGPIWNEKALVKALKDRVIAGIATDVYEMEPFTKDRKNVFAEFDNVILSPHLAAHTNEALIKMSLVAKDVIAVLERNKLKFPVKVN